MLATKGTSAHPFCSELGPHDCRITTRYDEHFIEMKNADLHDLRDTETTRELYIADSVATGIKRNRKRVLIRRSEVVAVSALDDVVDE